MWPGCCQTSRTSFAHFLSLTWHGALDMGDTQYILAELISLYHPGHSNPDNDLSSKHHVVTRWRMNKGNSAAFRFVMSLFLLPWRLLAIPRSSLSPVPFQTQRRISMSSLTITFLSWWLFRKFINKFLRCLGTHFNLPADLLHLIFLRIPLPVFLSTAVFTWP